MANDKIHVEVAYATSERQLIIPVEVDATCTVEEAIYFSGILTQFPEIDLAQNKIGIYSKPTKLGDKLKDSDRVEIYRELLIDPKQARRLRSKIKQSRA